jgi:DNA-binding IclR family transcriptional regulator
MSKSLDDPQASTALRVLRLAELLLQNPQGLPAQELASQLDSSRSTLFWLLNSLKQAGYVEQVEKRGRYRAGPRLAAWQGSPPGLSVDLTQAFYQEADRRAPDSGIQETLALVTPAPAGPLVLAQVEGKQRIHAALQTGQSYPGLSAAAQVFAADPLPEVRELGCALAAGPEIIDLALPVCRDGRRPDAALLFSAPAFRWQPDALLAECLPELRAMAARLSYQLGAIVYAPYQFGDLPLLKPTASLSVEEIGAFLSGPWTARLACIRPDGRPHVIPVWQEWDGRSFRVITWQGSQWAAFLRQNPNVSLTVDEPWPPLRRVTCRGLAEPLDAPFDLAALAGRLARRYLGQPPSGWIDQAEGAFRIVPETLRGYQGLS